MVFVKLYVNIRFNVDTNNELYQYHCEIHSLCRFKPVVSRNKWCKCFCFEEGGGHWW